MKTRIYLVLALMFLGVASILAQDVKTEKFKVYGNCGMCEKRIEKAVTDIDGVSLADWDKKTKQIKVTFNSSEVKLEDIHIAIAAVGHDTENQTAPEDVYNELPGCCKYDRPEKTE